MLIDNNKMRIQDINDVLKSPLHKRLPKHAMLASFNEEAQGTDRIVHVWTDGSCMNNGKKDSYGGWACRLEMERPDKTMHVREWFGGEKPTTNNRMEMISLIAALSRLRRNSKVVVHTDSKYLQNGITKWIHGWMRNGWRTTEGKPVLNQELWVKIADELKRHTVAFVWTKGHANDTKNNRVDKLAAIARDRIALKILEPRRCHAVPDDLK